MAGIFARLLGVLPAVLVLSAAVQSGEPAGKIRSAQELLEGGKPAEAIPLYRELAAEFPGVPSFGINLARAEYQAGEYRDAIAQCGALLKLRPDLFSAWLFLGESHLELGETASAVEPLRKAVALQPEDRTARVRLAGALLSLEKYEEAAPALEEAARLAPDVPRLWYGLGRSYEALSNSVFEQLERTAPNSAERRALAGFFALDRGPLPRAARWFHQALSINPALPGIHTALAVIYEKTGHADWAVFERSRERPPAACADPSPACDFASGRLRKIASNTAGDIATLYWRARALLDLARQAYGQLDGLPPSPEKHEAAARRLESAGLFGEAAGEWRAALKLSPASGDSQRRLAAALCRAGDYSSALPLLADLLRRDPTALEVNSLYGSALVSTKNGVQAIPYLEYAVKLNGDFLPARAALGQAYLAAGDAARAIPQLEAALPAEEDGSIHYQLARACQKAGQHAKAEAALRSYREILRRREAAEREDRQLPPP